MVRLLPVVTEHAMLTVKVAPGARRSAIVGWLDGSLKVRVAAPPVRGKANAAVVALLASALSLPERCVRVVAGHGSRVKRVRIDGLTQTVLDGRLAAIVD